MKINQLFLLSLLVFLVSTSLVSAEKIYILFDSGCMDRLEYQYTRTDGRSDYFVYHVNVRSGEKLILEVGEESANEQNYVPTPYLSCTNGGFDQSLMRRINANIDEVFIVYPKNNRSYTVSPVAIASYYSKTGDVVTYESPKYRFRFDGNYGTIGENIAYNNPGVKLYFEGRLANDCEGSYLFRQLSPQSAYPLINLVLTPEIGIVEESSGPNAAAAENNKISLHRVNGINLNRYMRDVCGTEPGSRRSIAAGTTPTDYFNPSPNTSNQNLPPGAVPLGGGTAEAQSVKIPGASEAGEPTQQTATTHTVASGETLYGISQQYGVAVNDIKAWNNLNNNLIRRGQVLKVAAPSIADNAAQEAYNPTPRPGLPVPYETNEFAAKAVPQHVVQPGETVASLALRYGYTEKRFREMNDMGPNDYIKVGQRLRTSDCDCPNTSTATTARTPAAANAQSSSVPMSYSTAGGGRIIPNRVYAENTTTTPSNNNTFVNRGATQNAQVPVSYATSTSNRVGNTQAGSYDYGAIVPQAYDAPAATNMSRLENGSGNRAIMPANRNNYSTPVSPQPSSEFNNDIFGNTASEPAPTSYNAFQYPDSYYRSSQTPAASSSNTPNQRRVHIVQEGESLYGIARQYNTTPERLRQLNNLGSTSTITAYQTLYIE